MQMMNAIHWDLNKGLRTAIKLTGFSEILLGLLHLVFIAEI